MAEFPAQGFGAGGDFGAHALPPFFFRFRRAETILSKGRHERLQFRHLAGMLEKGSGLADVLRDKAAHGPHQFGGGDEGPAVQKRPFLEARQPPDDGKVRAVEGVQAGTGHVEAFCGFFKGGCGLAAVVPVHRAPFRSGEDGQMTGRVRGHGHDAALLHASGFLP